MSLTEDEANATSIEGALKLNGDKWTGYQLMGKILSSRLTNKKTFIAATTQN